MSKSPTTRERSSKTKVRFKWCNDWRWKPPDPKRLANLELAVQIWPFGVAAYLRIRRIAIFRVEANLRRVHPGLFVRIVGLGFALWLDWYAP